MICWGLTSFSMMARFGCIDTGSLFREGLESDFKTCTEFSPVAVSWGWDSDLVVFHADQSAEEVRSSSAACSSAMSSAESRVFWASFIALLAIEANFEVSNQLMIRPIWIRLWATKLKEASSAICKSLGLTIRNYSRIFAASGKLLCKSIFRSTKIFLVLTTEFEARCRDFCPLNSPDHALL